jgi:pimeloyl-ACP methyl ester carboxylesterase
MVQAKHIAAALIAACLSGCSYAMLDNYTSPDKPVPPPTPTDMPSAMSDKASAMGRTAAEDQRTAPTAAVKPVVVPSTGNNGTPAEPSVVANDHVTVARGRAYLFRGIAGLIFSRGMDELAQRINRIGVAASVDTYLVWRGVANQAILDYRRDPKPITLIGHSMGGDSAVAFAEYLNAADIPVSLLVTYDPSRFAGNVPGNVERYINIYQSRSVMGGGNVVGGRAFHGHYASFNLSDHGEIVHINIEKMDRIHEQLVAKVRALAATPASAAGEAVPLRIDFPPTASIELWDSGLPVAARAGDTLQTLAATYHVPPWALTQINRKPEDAPLTEGERIIVPRYLAPMAAPVVSYAPAGR